MPQIPLGLVETPPANANISTYVSATGSTYHTWSKHSPLVKSHSNYDMWNSLEVKITNTRGTTFALKWLYWTLAVRVNTKCRGHYTCTYPFHLPTLCLGMWTPWLTSTYCARDAINYVGVPQSWRERVVYHTRARYARVWYLSALNQLCVLGTMWLQNDMCQIPSLSNYVVYHMYLSTVTTDTYIYCIHMYKRLLLYQIEMGWNPCWHFDRDAPSGLLKTRAFWSKCQHGFSVHFKVVVVKLLLFTHNSQLRSPHFTTYIWFSSAKYC